VGVGSGNRRNFTSASYLRIAAILGWGSANRDEVIGEWRKLHNEELNDMYSLPNIVRVKNRGKRDGRGM
jgi:hypothetical protein